MAEVKRVTEAQLADILKGFRLAVRTEDGGLVNGEVHVPDNVALHVFRSVGAPLREPHPTGPRPADADLCARCLNQFKPGQVCDACRESHSYQLAEALKPDAPADPEVAAIAALAPALAAVRALEHDARTRVMEWARCRVHAGLPPF